jgi:hypothetical protein
VGVSSGTAVASGKAEGSPQAMIIIERIKMKDGNVIGLLGRFMDTSFFEESNMSIIQASRPYGRPAS